LASLATAGVKTSEHDFSREHGSASSGEELLGIADNSFLTSSIVAG